MASTLNAGNLMLYARQAVGASSNMSLNAAQCRALGINTAFIVLTLIVMCMRMWARLVVTKALGTDDVVMLAGTVFTVSLSIAIIIAVVRGIGKIRADIATDEWEPMLSAFWVSRLLYAVAMLLVKVALLLFYLRLDNRKMMRWSVYGLMVLRQKWAVSAIFAFGAVSIAAACVRFYYVRQLANEPELYRQLADSLIC
ncbi:hypothetical protein C8035_v002350 [Colletotrichum spinosum]|uniref:Rhodopsin domain-containing protein n=1 Tax=Colletotrichum spinosum TaxID=1347390 RepID=A0A4R8Q6E3_9PEZI|nr:hypothetical protein C8035_v002350 [Colletotrichum spinosum]